MRQYASGSSDSSGTLTTTSLLLLLLLLRVSEFAGDGDDLPPSHSPAAALGGCFGAVLSPTTPAAAPSSWSPVPAEALSVAAGLTVSEGLAPVGVGVGVGASGEGEEGVEESTTTTRSSGVKATSGSCARFFSSSVCRWREEGGEGRGRVGVGGERQAKRG